MQHIPGPQAVRRTKNRPESPDGFSLHDCPTHDFRAVTELHGISGRILLSPTLSVVGSRGEAKPEVLVYKKQVHDPSALRFPSGTAQRRSDAAAPGDRPTNPDPAAEIGRRGRPAGQFFPLKISKPIERPTLLGYHSAEPLNGSGVAGGTGRWGYMSIVPSSA